ncbi:hypothetical protein ACWFQ8_33455 [Streptomyces sp. NPDC055254]
MLLLLVMARGPLLRRQRWAWTAIAISLTAWFFADTGFSLAVGATTHALFNVAFAATLGIPMAGLRRRLNT